MGSVNIIRASAGSGKTFRLAYQYIRTVVKEPMLYRHILAVTFTNKATAEMKSRIVGELDALGRGEGQAYRAMLAEDTGFDSDTITRRARTARDLILHDYSRFSVLTIDRFFQRIIRAFIKELNMDPGFTLELGTESLLSRAADMLIDEMAEDGQLRRWITALVEDKIAANEKWDVKAGLVDLGGQIFGEGYGTGTVRNHDTLEKTVASLTAEAAKIVNRMRTDARQALEIMGSHGLAPSDFSGGTRSFANYFTKVSSGDIAVPTASVLAAVESDEKWYSKTSPLKDRISIARAELKPILGKICEDHRKNICFLNSVELVRKHYRNYGLLERLGAKVEELCRETGIMPIAFTNSIINSLVTGNDTPFIFEKSGNHYSRFMIDEFQDTSGMQWSNFVPLLRNAVSQSPGQPVLLVGDVKQSIYRWRGGDWRILMEQAPAVFDAGFTDLAVNFRSLANVVAFNNELITGCVRNDNEQLNLKLVEAVSQGLIPKETAAMLKDTVAKAYDGCGQYTPEGKSGGLATVTVFGKNEDDRFVPPVIAKVEELQEKGHGASDIAILVRFKKEGIEIANLLMARKKERPDSPYCYDVVTQEALGIESSPAVHFILACFRFSFSSGDLLSLAVINRWLDRDVTEQPDGELAGFFEGLSKMPPQEAFESVSMRFGLEALETETIFTQALYEQIIDFSRSVNGDLQYFVKWWGENGSGKSVNMTNGNRAITIITIHKAKGLQYKAVIVPYCSWRLGPKPNSIVWAASDADGFSDMGQFPVGYCEKMGASVFAKGYFSEQVLSHVDNINLLYVAATRAEEELHLMIPENEAKKDGSIGQLVMESLLSGGNGMRLGDMEGRAIAGDGYVTYAFGEGNRPTVTHVKNASDPEQILVPVRSYPVSDRLKLKSYTGRYTEDNDTNVISPRDYGILMHRVLENAGTATDIPEVIRNMAVNGYISGDEAESLARKISRALSNHMVARWFDSTWDEVRSENAIIVPDGQGLNRPDRVVAKDGRAVVIDYKFGLKRSDSHARQVISYARLMERMGYRSVEGYVWYVNLEDIVRVYPTDTP